MLSVDPATGALRKHRAAGGVGGEVGGGEAVALAARAGDAYTVARAIDVAAGAALASEGGDGGGGARRLYFTNGRTVSVALLDDVGAYRGRGVARAAALANTTVIGLVAVASAPRPEHAWELVWWRS